MDIVAHRGLHTAAPENSLAAIRDALRAGLSFIEVDVRVSRDGELFLLHDATLDRTTARAGRLASIDAARAVRVTLADGSPLPRLAAALELVEHRAVLCLDVKEPAAIEPLRRRLRGLNDQVEVWSSHPGVIRTCAADGLRVTLISQGVMARGIGSLIWTAWDLGAGGLSFYPADLDPHVAAACRNAAMPFLCGVPNDEPTWRYLAGAGARGIITDRPLECRARFPHGTGLA